MQNQKNQWGLLVITQRKRVRNHEKSFRTCQKLLYISSVIMLFVIMHCFYTNLCRLWHTQNNNSQTEHSCINFPNSLCCNNELLAEYQLSFPAMLQFPQTKWFKITFILCYQRNSILCLQNILHYASTFAYSMKYTYIPFYFILSQILQFTHQPCLLQT